MISDKTNASTSFVWVWLPNHATPIVAGKLVHDHNRYWFVYGKSYRERADAIALSPFELPLTDAVFESSGMQIIPSCLRDALPDAWGRRLIDYQYPHLQKNELDYGLLSGSDRIGALDFQSSASTFIARDLGNVNLKIIDQLAIALETNHDFPASLAPVLLHGTSVGGARPKCLITIDHVDYIAKFSLSSDPYPFLRAEFLAMQLAKFVGIHVADVMLKEIHGRDILLIKRFDRHTIHRKKFRKLMLSGLSLLGLDELEARYASYSELADVIRMHFNHPTQQLTELYKRLVFNVVVGNTDDHARNHSAFWDGKSLQLTPAYDISPQLRVGFEATQAMRIDGVDAQASTLKNVLSVCDRFLLSEIKAKKIINHQITVLNKRWSSLCDASKLNKREQNRLLGSVIKSDYCLLDWEV